MKKYWTSGVMMEITQEKPGETLYYSREIVMRNLHSLRDAIDDAMTMFPASGNRSGN